MKFSRISLIVMALAVVYCLGLIAVSGGMTAQQTASLQNPEMEYEASLFDSSYVHIIDIQVEEEEWKQLKRNAMSKECIDSTVVIDGEEMVHVGVRTKGNSTLLMSAAKGWDRLSLVLEFDAFQESQRFHGLDCLSLYNNIFDASCMKTYLCYEMMRSMGVKTPLCSFVALHLNGEFIGMYSASETFSESFALRNFGYDYGNIYKPEQFDLAAILTGELRNTKLNLAAFTGSDGGKFTIDSGMTISNEAVRLAYLGESLYDYEDIWRNTSFPIGTSDKRRLVNALRQISENDHPEQVLDMDALARYFAVNTFVLNTDCYTTGMAHNYGLYEKDGVLTMLPWDYDVALGNIGSEFGDTDPTRVINQPIDTPVAGTTVEERPLLKALLDSEEGSALYRRYLAELLELWIDTGLLQSEIDRIAEMVRPWVAQETLTVYSLAEHDQAVESVGKFVSYRAQSVRGQLEGTIPSTQEGQISAPDLLPDFSDYAPPESGIMKVLLPEAESGEVSGEALLQVLPEANANLYDTVSILALLNLVDWGQVMSMDLSAMGSEDSDEPADPEKEAAVKRALLSFLPYVFDLAGILLTFIAVPVVILLALRYARRWRRKGGVRRVV